MMLCDKTVRARCLPPPITKLIGLMLILNFYYYALQPTASSDRPLVRKLHFPHSRIHISIGDLPAVR